MSCDWDYAVGRDTAFPFYHLVLATHFAPYTGVTDSDPHPPANGTPKLLASSRQSLSFPAFEAPNCPCPMHPMPPTSEPLFRLCPTVGEPSLPSLHFASSYCAAAHVSPPSVTSLGASMPLRDPSLPEHPHCSNHRRPRWHGSFIRAGS